MLRRRPILRGRLRAIAIRVAFLLASTRSAAINVLRSGRAIPVEVVIADATRRRALTQEIHRALRQLRRAFGPDLVSGLAVIVQQTVATDHSLIGCVQTHQRPDGVRVFLVRLALQVDGHRQTTDDLLAALADACVGIVVQSASVSVLVPLEQVTSPSTPTTPPMSSDPLAPSPNGTVSRARISRRVDSAQRHELEVC